MTLTFKIQIRGIKKPPVWRRIEIPANLTFEDFHLTIQRAFGWENYHLYQFQRQPYGGDWSVRIPDDMDGSPFHNRETVISAKDTLVGEFIKKQNLKKFVYVYDFGDDWVHDITLEKTDDAGTLLHPVCLDGKGACPPEDCGGPWGYESIKELFREDPYGEEAQDYMEWMGLDSVNDFDPNHVSIVSVNSLLSLIRPKESKPTKSQLPQKQNKGTDAETSSETLINMLDRLTGMVKKMSDEEREEFLNVMLGNIPISEIENQEFYRYKKPDYEKNIPQALRWLSPFWNAQYDDDKVELCHFVEQDGRHQRFTPEDKREEMRGYMNMLFARFDKDRLENRWKLYGPLWMMEREKMTDCLDLVLEALRQDSYFIHAYILRYDEWPSAVIYQLGKDQIDTLEGFLYEQGIIPDSKPVVFNALLWTLIRQPEKRLRITAIVTKFLNHCLDICKKGASTINVEHYALALASAHVKETLPILQRMFSELDIKTLIVNGGIDDITRLMNDPETEFYCKYDSLDQYLNDEEEIEESQAASEAAYFGPAGNGDDPYYDDDDPYYDDDDPYYDDDADDLYDIEGIYDLSEPAERYEIRIEKTEPASQPSRTVQLPSNMTLDGFAKLIMLAHGQEKLPEPYEFEDAEKFRYLSDEEDHALDKHYWLMDPTDINTVGILLQKKGETAQFKIRKGKRKVIERYSLKLEKKGRYGNKTKHRIDLLKASALPKNQFDDIRRQLHDFEAENEQPF